MGAKPSTIDPSVGLRIRLRRKTIGMTQAELASSVGVSFQQMQKYEKGLNAISSDRLQQICEVLNLPPNFFEQTSGPLIGLAAQDVSVEGRGQVPVSIDHFLDSGEGRRLVTSFMTITDQRLRTRILDFIASVAADHSAG